MQKEDFDKNMNHYYIAEKSKVYKRAGDAKIYDRNEIEINFTYYNVVMEKIFSEYIVIKGEN